MQYLLINRTTVYTQERKLSSGIFDFIMRLYEACKNSYRGDWDALANACKVSHADVNAFLEYAATFLSNMGNYYVWSITVYWGASSS